MHNFRAELKNIRLYIDSLLELAKVRITFFVAISGMVGYIQAGNGIDWNVVPILFGIFILDE